MFKINFIKNWFEKITHKKERKEEKRLLEEHKEYCEYMTDQYYKYLDMTKQTDFRTREQFYRQLLFEYRVSDHFNTKGNLGYVNKSKFSNKYYDKLNKKLSKELYKIEMKDIDNANGLLVNSIDEKFKFHTHRTYAKVVFAYCYLGLYLFVIVSNLYSIASSLVSPLI